MPTPDPTTIEGIRDWLIAGAGPPADLSETIRRLIGRMAGAGLVVERFTAFILTIHPTVEGRSIAWSAAEGVVVSEAPRGFMEMDVYHQSPIKVVYETAAPLRAAFHAGADPAAYPAFGDLVAAGTTDYYAQPLTLVGGETHALSWTSRAPGGFSDAQIAALDRLNPAIARLIEIHTLKTNTIALLDAYLGRDAGARVLAGSVHRGDAERIRAVLLFADFTDFTAQSNAFPPEQVIAALNRFYDALAAALSPRGGEILKFIGDEVLAIFPLTDDAPATARAALEAVEVARVSLALTPHTPPIAFRAALHVGEVVYGNIGSVGRLDFTVMGPAVNLTARILSVAAQIGADTVCSDAFAALTPDLAGARSTHGMKGFDTPQGVVRL